MKVYFFCYPHGPADKAGYEHQIISLAEGLKYHNVAFNGNVDYWKSNQESSFLIKHESDAYYKDFDAVVFSSTIFNYDRLDLLPPDLFNTKRKYKLVFIDDSDGLITPGLDERISTVDIVLKSHFSKKYPYPKNFVPWQFGLTNRIISSAMPVPFQERNKDIIVNFRVKHGVRDLAEKKVMNVFYKYFASNNEVDSLEVVNNLDKNTLLMWRQTGRRHYPGYYERLGKSVACAAFGGYFAKSVIHKPGFFFSLLNSFGNTLNLPMNNWIYQFDSWRFWESLVSGCCTIHIDLEKYGAALPVMPVNGKHYIGVDFNNLSRLKKLLKRNNIFEDIGNAGREWVIQNYSPHKIAERFLNLTDKSSM